VFEKEENFKKLEYCLGTLTDQQREAIRLFYLEGNVTMKLWRSQDRSGTR
jgi:DNA-directed RNA polymerase specialized sigma24 family protein